MSNLEFTIKVLEKLNVPYELKNGVSQKLIIDPQSSPQMECLPGEWVNTEDGRVELHCDITRGDLITPEYVAGLIESLCKTI